MYNISMLDVIDTALRFDSPQQEAFLNLWRTYDRLRMLEDGVFGRYDLTAQQYNALRLLRSAYPQKVATLALSGQLVSRAPDITRLLDKLFERGFIERYRPEEDRRSVQVGITETGLELLNDLSVEVRECHERQLGHMRAEDLAQMVQLLREARRPHEVESSGWR
jgi:DNA-binding MarR family transcriptional regulator